MIFEPSANVHLEKDDTYLPEVWVCSMLMRHFLAPSKLFFPISSIEQFAHLFFVLLLALRQPINILARCGEKLGEEEWEGGNEFILR